MAVGYRRMIRATGRTGTSVNIDAVGMSIPGTQLAYAPDATMKKHLDDVVRTGSQYLRFDIAWVQIEGNQGSLDWSNIDRIVNASLTRGLKLIGIITTLAPWARANGGTWQTGPTTAGERTAFATFARQVASRYSGKFAAYEIWNEPNLDQFWAPTPNAMHYTALLQTAATAIRSVDTTTTILTGGTGGAGGAPDIDSLTFVTGIYTNGGRSSFDGVAVHPYINLDNTPLPNGELAKAIQIRTLMNQRGDANKLLWGTEVGAPTAGQSDTATEARQAALVPEVFSIWRSQISRRGPLCWYTLTDSTSGDNDRESYFGIQRADGSDKPAFEALRTLSYTTVSPPTAAARGDLIERQYRRVYTVPNLVAGAAASAAANTTALQTALNQAQDGDCLLIPAGTYRLASTVTFNNPGVTIKGTGALRTDVVFESTNEFSALFMVQADNIHFYNFTKRVYSTARSDQGQSGQGSIWVQNQKTGFRMQDVLVWGSRDAAVMLYGAHNFRFNRVESRDSRSDAYHVTNASSYGEFYDCISTNSGDDGIGIVGYGNNPADRPHHHTIARHTVNGNTWGRGIGMVHTYNNTLYGPTLIQDTSAAGLIVSREPSYGSGAVAAIAVHGELRLRRCNTGRLSAGGDTPPDHGALIIVNADAANTITGVVIDGPVICTNTGVGGVTPVSAQVRLVDTVGGGMIQASISDVSFYGNGPSQVLDRNLTDTNSSLATPGWSATTGYSGATEPPFPLP